MDKDQTKSEIVRQYYKERTAGTLMIIIRQRRIKCRS